MIASLFFRRMGLLVSNTSYCVIVAQHFHVDALVVLFIPGPKYPGMGLVN
jgi:hypothetical protein